MRTKNIILYVIICLIIIAGIAVWDSKGFNTELQFSSRYEIQLTNNKGINTDDINQIASEVLGDSRFFVQKVEKFGNAVQIVAEEMNEDKKNQIVEKFNEKYKEEVKKEDVKIKYIPFTRVKDVIKQFLIPGVISLLLVLCYFMIRYKKLGWKCVVIKTVIYPIIAELLMYSIMSIIRIPFGRLAISMSVVLYLAIIFMLTCIFENKLNKYNEENKNKKDQDRKDEE